MIRVPPGVIVAAFACAFLGVAIPALAQDPYLPIEQPVRRQRIAGAVGYTYIREAANGDRTNALNPDKGVLVPTVGIEYAVHLPFRFLIGVGVDVELDDYFIVKDDLERNYPVIVSGFLSFQLTEAWEVFAGGGIELEESQNLYVGRAGTGYVYPINETGLSLSPWFTYHYKETYDSWTGWIRLAKRF